MQATITLYNRRRWYWYMAFGLMPCKLGVGPMGFNKWLSTNYLHSLIFPADYGRYNYGDSTRNPKSVRSYDC